MLTLDAGGRSDGELGREEGFTNTPMPYDIHDYELLRVLCQSRSLLQSIQKNG